jgi:hypothetical protein
MITYTKATGKFWGVIVKVDGKKVGAIRSYPQGYTYKPNGTNKPGEFFPSIEAVKRSLEEV